MGRQTEKESLEEALQLVLESEGLDAFLGKKFGTFKRYGCEGAESMVVMLKALFQSCDRRAIEKVVLAMPHRGRLNVLVNLLEYPLSELIAKIQGRSDTPDSLYNCTDDVVSHVSCSNRAKDAAVNVSLLHNPSHLETSNAVSQGKTRAK